MVYAGIMGLPRFSSDYQKLVFKPGTEGFQPVLVFLVWVVSLERSYCRIMEERKRGREREREHEGQGQDQGQGVRCPS